MKKLIGIVLGLILVACGVIYGLDAVGITHINVSFDGWWALFIIIPCLDGLIRGKDKIGSFIGLAIGILLFLAARDIFDFSLVWKLIVPIIIIMIGLKIIAKSFGLFDSEKIDPNNIEVKATECSGSSEKSENMAVFTSKTIDYKNSKVSDSKVGAVFGGVKCNLSDAIFDADSQLDVMCVFGGADIIVPENVRVKIDAFCLFGGISDKRVIKAQNQDENTAVLNINGFCFFGGADIK